MVHVGFSRPTHLLCVAICEDHLTKENRKILEETDLDPNKEWIIQNVT